MEIIEEKQHIHGSLLTISLDPNNILALSSSCGDVPSSAEPLFTFICNFCLIAWKENYYTIKRQHYSKTPIYNSVHVNIFNCFMKFAEVMW
jgi:hypothetical protein